MKRSRPVARKAAKPTLEGEIAQLRDLDLKGLRLRWQNVFRRQTPFHLPRHLLLAVIAYRLQADQLGDLSPDIVRLLKQIASKGTSEAAVRLTSEFHRRRGDMRPGTLLMREWEGCSHRVMVVDEGFAWNGKTFDSLSKIACAITGTRWSGPRFFGLRDKVTAEVET
jgi:hypothetical protein